MLSFSKLSPNQGDSQNQKSRVGKLCNGDKKGHLLLLQIYRAEVLNTQGKSPQCQACPSTLLDAATGVCFYNNYHPKQEEGRAPIWGLFSCLPHIQVTSSQNSPVCAEGNVSKVSLRSIKLLKGEGGKGEAYGQKAHLQALVSRLQIFPFTVICFFVSKQKGRTHSTAWLNRLLLNQDQL